MQRGVIDAQATWVVRHSSSLRRAFRMLFGFIWGIDGALKLQPETPFWFSERVLAASIGQPSWLSGWYAFWVVQAQQYAALDVGVVAFLELALAVALILGALRKVAYVGGIGLALIIWAVPEGFGGPYGTGSFDVGAGIIYVAAFMFLVIADAGVPAPIGTLDSWIERRWPRWSRWSDL